MQKSSDSGNNFDEAREGSPRSEPVIGDADDVPKTTYVVGQGTDPTAPDPDYAAARVASGGGINVGAWIVGAIAVIVALIYAFGVFT